jgi:uncharacterized cupin superfamily protein
MSDKSIIKLSESPKGFGKVADALNTALFDSTPPTQHSHICFSDEELGLYIGVWGSTDMIESTTSYPRDEFMFIIEGAVEIKNNKTGKIEIITAGESVVIPQGYDCQWHQQGYLRKFYVVYEPQEKLGKPVTEKVVHINENKDVPWQETSDGHRKKVLYKNNEQRFTAGVWQSKALTTGLIDFPYHEFILINQGSLICTDESGGEHHFKTGDALFIPQGTRCAWQVEHKVSIHFTQIK